MRDANEVTKCSKVTAALSNRPQFVGSNESQIWFPNLVKFVKYNDHDLILYFKTEATSSQIS